VSEPSEAQTIGMVAAGGVLGAGARWAIAAQLLPDLSDGFPWVILGVNAVGCFLIGLVSTRVPRGSLAWAFIATGLLGGFTTMSSFAVALNDLATEGRDGAAVMYALATVATGFAALAAAEALRGPIDDRETRRDRIE